MHIFDNLSDAVSRLSKHSKNFHFPIRSNLITSNDIIKFSVGKSIFRAMSIETHKPSDVYRNWATEYFKSLHKQFTNCRNQLEFDDIIKDYTESFLNNWYTTTNEKLVYGPASKIVNLLVKAIQESNRFKVDRIISYQHVPWDSYTLRPLRNVISELSTRNYSINIPTTAAMSFVNTPELYKELQLAIFKLYDKVVGQPPTIYFDYFAWNDNH